ncbi:MAG: tryptophan synthase subunit alpha [Gemmatimonadota bacterium]|nr:tryptophan synthase subunit alpha [Gemmatimonadota bacterium]
MSDRGPGGIARCWARLATDGRTALIPYVTAGYPSHDATVDTLRMLASEGADLIEVGIPFSDPLADGPIIQHASFEALRQGTTVAGVLEMIRTADLAVPVVVFSYLNPILQYGTERFLADAESAGAAGMLLTDLPVGGDPGVEQAIRRSGLDRIPLVALTTDGDRLASTVGGGSGFVYLISRLGVTGTHTTIGTEVEHMVERIRTCTSLPVAVGFGITGAEQAAAVARYADGIVVGSALVERMGRDAAAARELVRTLRQALDAVGVAG